MRGKALFAATSALMLLAIACVGWIHSYSHGVPSELEAKPGTNLLASAIKDLWLDKPAKPRVSLAPKKVVEAVKPPHDIADHIPSLEERAIVQLFEKPKHLPAKPAQKKAAAPAQQSHEEKKKSNNLGTVAAVQKYQEQQEKDSFLEKEKMEREEGLPAFGTQQYKVALAKAKLDENWARLKIAKLRQKKDATIADFQQFEKHGYKQARHLQKRLAFREKREAKKAEKLQAEAKQMTEDVIKDLNVKDGKFDIHQWYRSQAARKASTRSTRDVEEAKHMWAAATQDRQRLRALEQRSIFREHEEKLSAAEVALRVSKKEIADTQARLAAYKQRVTDLRAEAPIHTLVHSTQTPTAPPSAPGSAVPAPAPVHAARAEEHGEKQQQQQQQQAAGESKSRASAGQAAEGGGEYHAHVAKEAESDARLAADERKGEVILEDEMEGGGKGRLEELASSESAILKAEKADPVQRKQGLRLSTGQRVADLVYQQAEVHRKLEAKGYKGMWGQEQKLPLLQRKLIFNW